MNSLKFELLSKVFSVAFSDKCKYVEICNQIATFEFFEKIYEELDSSEENQEEPKFYYKCRRHDWIEGYVCYTFFGHCEECFAAMNHRAYTIFRLKFPEFEFPDIDDEKKYPNIKRTIIKKPECFAKPGTLQKKVPDDELEDFYKRMEDIYPFPEEFI
jgi:hypothetical protein